MLSKEPTLIFNGIAEILRQLVPLLIVFGFIHWTDVQIAAFFAFSSVVLTFTASLLTRNNTVSTVTADKQIEIAKASPVTRSTEEIIKEAAK